MAEFKQALRERLKKLDDEHQKRNEVYQRHRAALLTAIECETGCLEDEPEPVVSALMPVTMPCHLMASQTNSPSSPIDTEMHGVSAAYIRNQLGVVKAAIR